MLHVLVRDSNKLNQKNYIMNAGFSARITKLSRNNKILYIVRIGYFSTSQEADKIGKKIKSNLDLNTLVVKNNYFDEILVVKMFSVPVVSSCSF